MGRDDDTRREPEAGPGPFPAQGATGGQGARPVPRGRAEEYDRNWARDVRSGARCAALSFTLLLAVDLGFGGLTPVRAALWLGLALLLFAVLCPARVRAGDGWLASRGLLREHRVRTDLLVSVRCVNGVSGALALQDVFGGRVEIDPAVLSENPGLWHRLDEGARHSERCGSLTYGAGLLHGLAERIDRETARNVFRTSGLE